MGRGRGEVMERLEMRRSSSSRYLRCLSIYVTFAFGSIRLCWCFVLNPHSCLQNSHGNFATSNLTLYI